MLKLFGTLLLSAFTAVFLQNLVLCGGFGLSRLLQSARQPRHMAWFCAAVLWFSTLLSLCCAFLFSVPALSDISQALRILITGGVLLACYFVTLLPARFLFHATGEQLRQLGACAFNSLVMAVPLINLRLANPVAQSIGLGLGAGLSFALSVWLLAAGVRAIEKNTHIPKAFQGLPALFIYVGILSLAFMAVFGRSYMA